MSMQKWIASGLVMALVAATQIARGDDGRPSQATLKQMGLAGLVEMSDTEAALVRGQGFTGSHSSATASGRSYATFDVLLGNAHSSNQYNANGSHYASGNNNSYAGAGLSIITTGGKNDWGGPRTSGASTGGGSWHPGGSGGGYNITAITLTVFAGGSSSAKAW